MITCRFFNGAASALKSCRNGDRVGVGIRLEEVMDEGIAEKCPVFFTLNGKEVFEPHFTYYRNFWVNQLPYFSDSHR